MDLARLQPYALALLRIVAALILLEHGLMKLVAWPGPQPGAPSPLPPLLLTAAILEVVFGALLLIGFLTSLSAFIVSGEMAAAYFIGHYPKSFWPGLNGGDLAVILCFVFLYIVFAGAGALSVDGRRTRRRR